VVVAVGASVVVVGLVVPVVLGAPGAIDVVVDTVEAVVVVSVANAAARYQPSESRTTHSRAAGRRMIDPQEACSYDTDATQDSFEAAGEDR
jgi:hypothetical protein